MTRVWLIASALYARTARFLYHVVSDSDAAAKSSGWEPDFFACVRARWSGTAQQPVADWLTRELDHWMPASLQAGTAAPSDDGAG